MNELKCSSRPRFGRFLEHSIDQNDQNITYFSSHIADQARTASLQWNTSTTVALHSDTDNHEEG